MFSGPCETSRENANACENDPRFGAGDCRLEVFREAAAAVEPSKCAFDHPAFRLSLEGADTLRPCDDFNGPFAKLGDRVEQLVAAVDTVSEDVPQLGKRVADMFQQRYRTVIVLDISLVHLHGKQRAVRIGGDVTFAPFHLLARIKSARTAAFRRFYALTVDDTGRGSALASRGPARALDQGAIDPAPNLPVAPIVEIMLNRRVGRKVFRQSAPLAAGCKNVEDRIHDHAKIHLTWTPHPALLRQQSPQQFPLLVSRVACITKPIAPILFAGDFGPSHVVPFVESQTRRNHNRAEITCFLFGQPLRSALARLEGWRHGTDLRPSFETRARARSLG